MTKRLVLALTALLSAGFLAAAGHPGGEITPVPVAAVATPGLVCAAASGVGVEPADLFLFDPPGRRSPDATSAQPVAYEPPPGFCPETQCNRNLDCFLQRDQGVYECPWQTAPICQPCGVVKSNCEGYCDCL